MIKTNSKEIKLGDWFIAIKGPEIDGHNYINEAIENGASVVIGEEPLTLKVPYIIVENSKKTLGSLLKILHKDISSKFKIIGVTGTNGKTTTALFLFQMLNKLGKNSAYIGTNGVFYNGKHFPLNNTTPSIEELYKYFEWFKKDQIEYVVMEVSSIALEQERVFGIRFDVSIFLNISEDHLDYHKTKENYILAKQKLFSQLDQDSFAIINQDDSEHIHFTKTRAITTFFSMDEVYNIHQSIDGLGFWYQDHYFNPGIIGTYNIYNLLAVFKTLDSLGFSKLDYFDLVNSVRLPEGRLERLEEIDLIVYVDFAHTPKAVYSVLNTLSELKNGRLITIVGCGGNRDKDKRKWMGQYAYELSDIVVFTSDNPRWEEPIAIINDMLYNIEEENGKNYHIIIDRKEAIFYGLGLMQENDVLVILGKGHETYQEIKGKKMRFSDKEIVIELVKGS